MSIFDGPTDFATTKDRAIKRAMRDGAAAHIEALARQTGTVLPADQLFTTGEVVALLEGFAQGLRGEPAPKAGES